MSQRIIRRAHACALCLLLATFGGCPAQRAAAPALPQVELASFAPDVRAQIGQAQARAAAQPEDAAASGELGMTLHAYGLFDAAAICYARARSFDPTDFRWPYYQGLVLTLRGRSTEAIEALLRATALRPAERPAQLELARQLRAAGRTEESRARLSALEADAANDPLVLFELGGVLLDLGATDAAIARLEHALELAGDRGDLHYALALAYQRAGDAERAAAHFAAHEQFKDRPLVGVTALPAEIARLDIGLQAAVRRERGRRLALAGDYAGALALVDGQTRTAPWAEYALALRSARTGQPLTALPLLQRAREHAEQADDGDLVSAIDAELRRALGAITP